MSFIKSRLARTALGVVAAAFIGSGATVASAAPASMSAGKALVADQNVRSGGPVVEKAGWKRRRHYRRHWRKWRKFRRLKRYLRHRHHRHHYHRHYKRRYHIHYNRWGRPYRCYRRHW